MNCKKAYKWICEYSKSGMIPLGEEYIPNQCVYLPPDSVIKNILPVID